MNHYDSNYAANLDRDDEFQLRAAPAKRGERKVDVPEQIKRLKERLSAIESEIRAVSKEVGTSFRDMAADLEYASDVLKEAGDILGDYSESL